MKLVQVGELYIKGRERIQHVLMLNPVSSEMKLFFLDAESSDTRVWPGQESASDLSSESQGQSYACILGRAACSRLWRTFAFLVWCLWRGAELAGVPCGAAIFDAAGRIVTPRLGARRPISKGDGRYHVSCARVASGLLRVWAQVCTAVRSVTLKSLSSSMPDVG